MELLREKAVRSAATAAVVALTLAMSTVFAQPASTDGRAGVDDPTRTALLQPRDQNASTAVAVEPAAQAAQAPAVSVLPEEDDSPIKTLLMILAGILLCAAATAGLVLTILALRRDIQRRKRAHRRRLQPMSRDSAITAEHR